MATSIHSPVNWDHAKTQTTENNLWKMWLAFTAGQKKFKTFWFLFALLFQGIFFLPLPAALAFYYGAPEYIVAITLILFFANVIAGMGGSGIRTMLTLFALSIIVHLCLVLIYVW